MAEKVEKVQKTNTKKDDDDTEKDDANPGVDPGGEEPVGSQTLRDWHDFLKAGLESHKTLTRRNEHEGVKEHLAAQGDTLATMCSENADAHEKYYPDEERLEHKSDDEEEKDQEPGGQETEEVVNEDKKSDTKAKKPATKTAAKTPAREPVTKKSYDWSAEAARRTLEREEMKLEQERAELDALIDELAS